MDAPQNLIPKSAPYSIFPLQSSDSIESAFDIQEALPTITTIPSQSCPIQTHASANTELITNNQQLTTNVQELITQHITHQIELQLKIFTDSNTKQLNDLATFTHQLDTAHQCFLQKHDEQMRNAEFQIQSISSTQNEVKHAVE